MIIKPGCGFGKPAEGGGSRMQRMTHSAREKGGRTAQGRAQALAAAVMFSISGVCIKAIPWSPLAINGARGAVGALVIALWMALTGRRPRWNMAVLIGALSLCLTNVLYVFAAKLTTAANAILLQYTSPLFVMLLLWTFAGRRPAGRELTACMLVFGGTVLFFCDRLSPGSLLGSLMGLASGLSYAGVFLSGLPAGADGASSFLIAQLAGAVLGISFLMQENSFPPQALAAVVLLGVFQIGAGFLLLARALAAVGPVTANLLCAIEPILNPLWVALAFGERPGRFATAGAALVLAGVIGCQLVRAPRENAAKNLPNAARDLPNAAKTGS